MKVYIGPYKYWFGPYQLADTLQRVGVSEEKCHRIGKWLADTWVYDFLEWVSSKRKRTIIVKIDNYDTWSMDHTLSHIVVPMLKQLKETTHGSALVDDEDVPEHLRSTAPGARDGCEEWDSDKFLHARWEWAMGEMIWAHEQQLDDEAHDRFFDHSAVDKKLDLNEQISQIKVDQEGLDAWQKRKQNGFRLFGKYYEGLWD
jgi:hypothetical protein